MACRTCGGRLDARNACVCCGFFPPDQMPGWATNLASTPYPIDLPALADDNAIGEFSRAMMRKMAVGRAKGREGWRDCPVDVLWQMLRDHVEKGDPVDVANLAMMIWHLSARNG